MDKPSQTKPYAGLVIYRVQRNVEFLLLNDSFTNKKHWFCPKGQVIGNEDEIKCALRETYEATGLSPSELRIEEGFAIELKYLSGTKPKRVKYHLAQLLDNHVRLLPNAEGVHMQWHSQSTSSEKVMFKSMQDVFKHAQTFIETKRQKKKQLDVKLQSSVEKVKANKPLPQLQQQQPQQTQQQQQASPLYKTRLCERYEMEGSCPYGPKCNFAHGINELRGREVQQEDTPTPVPVPNNQSMDAGNQLFKTRLCEKFMKERFCQYGPKCHFAHGEHELKTRPKKMEEEVGEVRIGRRHESDNFDPVNERTTNWRNHKNDTRASETLWRSNHNGDANTYRTRSPPLSDEDTPAPGRGNRDVWRSNTTPISTPTPQTPPPPKTPPPVAVAAKEEAILIQRQPSPALEELRRPVFLEHTLRLTPPVVKKPVAPKEKKAMVAPVTSEKSWMKVLKLSKEEQDEMESAPAKTVCPSGKQAQTEHIIADLKKFFVNHVNSVATKGKLSEDVKEVTKIEMRNDLSKKQLLYILLVSLLEDADPISTLQILKSRDHLFKTLVKTNAEQILLLKGWEKFVNERKPLLVNKTAAALTHWYDCEMIEEEAFVQWYNTLSKDNPVEKKCVKFIEWLNESDEED